MDSSDIMQELKDSINNVEKIHDPAFAKTYTIGWLTGWMHTAIMEMPKSKREMFVRMLKNNAFVGK